MAAGTAPENEQLVFETAAEHMARKVPIAEPDALAGEVRRSLSGARFDAATTVVVSEGDRLRGLVRIEDLLAAPEDRPMSELMDRDPPVVSPGTSQEVAVWKAVQHGETALPVVDGQDRFVGLIPPARMLRVALYEHDKDLARLGGFLHDAAQARQTTRERVSRRFLHRLPWLLVGLVGAVAAAGILASFETRLEQNVVLAFFVPGIVYLADAIGTQTETLVIRGLSVGVAIGSIARREVITGVLVGLVLAAGFFPIAYIGWGDAEVATAAAVALFAASCIATVVAMALPALLHRLGRDPAFGSGPLATVIQDLLSILIYFLVAVLIVG